MKFIKYIISQLIDQFNITLNFEVNYILIAKLLAPSAIVTAILQYFARDILGIGVYMFIAITIILIGDVLSGILLARHYGEKFSVRKFGRIITKAGFIGFVITCIHFIRRGTVEMTTDIRPDIASEAINAIFGVSLAMISSLIALYLLAGVVQNFASMNIKIAMWLGKLIRLKLKNAEDVFTNTK